MDLIMRANLPKKSVKQSITDISSPSYISNIILSLETVKEENITKLDTIQWHSTI